MALNSGVSDIKPVNPKSVCRIVSSLTVLSPPRAPLYWELKFYSDLPGCLPVFCFFPSLDQEHIYDLGLGVTGFSEGGRTLPLRNRGFCVYSLITLVQREGHYPNSHYKETRRQAQGGYLGHCTCYSCQESDVKPTIFLSHFIPSGTHGPSQIIS